MSRLGRAAVVWLHAGIISSCTTATGIEELQFDPARRRPVPIARLLSVPEILDMRPTIVIGFLVYDGQESVLYQSREDARVGIQSNGVEIDVDDDSAVARTLLSLSGSYVMVFGQCRAPVDASPAVTIGRITDVKRVLSAEHWGREEQSQF